MEDTFLIKVPNFEFCNVKIEDNYTNNSNYLRIKEELLDNDASINVGEINSTLDIQSNFVSFQSQSTSNISDYFKKELHHSIDIKFDQDFPVCESKSTNQLQTPVDLSESDPLRRHPVFEEKHVCQICKKSFENRNNLKEHMNFCDGTHLYQRPIRPNLKLLPLLKHHQAVQANEKRYKCPECPKTFDIKRSVKNHVRYCHSKNVCNLCKKCFTNKTFLLSHMKTHDKTPSFQCSICPSQFKTEPELKGHQIVHTDERNFKFTFCNERFSSQYSLDVHTAIHVPRQKYICEICKKSTVSEIVLKKHLKTHKESPIFQCPLCPSKYKCKISWQFHQAAHASDSMEFSHEQTVKKHELEHEKIIETQAVQSSVCPAVKIRPNEGISALQGRTPRGRPKKHTVLHLPGKEYVCDICKKCSKNKTLLKAHLKTHDDSRPYQCSYCPIDFKCKKSWRSHEAAHASSESFKCTLCTKEFDHKYSLKEHVKTQHRNRVEHICDVCAKSFKNKTVLNDHMKTHSELGIEDTFCAEEFCVKEDPSEHESTHAIQDTFCAEEFCVKEDPSGHESSHAIQDTFCAEEFCVKEDPSEHEFTHAIQPSISPNIVCTNDGLLINPSQEYQVTQKNESQFKCSVCHSEFLDHLSFLNHVKLYNHEFYIASLESKETNSLIAVPKIEESLYY